MKPSTRERRGGMTTIVLLVASSVPATARTVSTSSSAEDNAREHQLPQCRSLPRGEQEE